MIFRIEGKEYTCATAVEVVREMERDSTDYSHRGETLRQFLSWSLAQLSDHIPLRELDLSNSVSDEKLALNFLCLCDEYGVGTLWLEQRIK